MVRVRLSSRRREESEPRRELELTCMSNLLSATEERVYFKDLQSRLLLVSAGWIAAYAPGRAAEELIGKTDFDVFSGRHASAAFRDEQQVIRTGEPIVGKVELETYGGRADTWVSTTKMALRDEHGQIIGTFGISRDVTAQITGRGYAGQAGSPAEGPERAPARAGPAEGRVHRSGLTRASDAADVDHRLRRDCSGRRASAGRTPTISPR